MNCCFPLLSVCLGSKNYPNMMTAFHMLYVGLHLW